MTRTATFAKAPSFISAPTWDDTVAGFLAGDVDASFIPEPAWGPIGKAVYERTYSRDLYVRDPATGSFLTRADGSPIPQPWLADLGLSVPAPAGPAAFRTNEVWSETIRRVVLGNLGFAAKTTGEPIDMAEAVELFNLMHSGRALPAGRHLWVVGTNSPWSRNCFAGETEVITRSGIQKIEDLAGQTVDVIDGNGGWVAAPFASYGTQALRAITLTRRGKTKTVYATADHGWFVRGTTKATGYNPRRIVTDELIAGHRLITRRASKVSPKTQGYVPSPVGIQAGFVFGDGTRSGAGSVAYFCGEKDAAMMKWFPNHQMHTKASGITYATGNPGFFKDPPSLSESHSYLYGWLAGYFAADGCMSSNGNMSLASARRENVEFALDVANVLGLTTYGITTQNRLGFGDEESPLHTLTFGPHTFTEDFFLIGSHQQNWSDRVDTSSQREDYWTVESVTDSGRVEEVFCCEVSTTQSFVLADNLLTSNCWSSGWSKRTSDHSRYLASRLFEGGGVGSNYSSDLIAVTSPVARAIQVRVTCRADHSDFEAVSTSAGDAMLTPAETTDFVISHGATLIAVEDTREGWVDAWSAVIDLATTTGPSPLIVVVDVSGLRPFGAPLRTFGGTASGPAPFVTAALEIAAVLRRAATETGGRQLSGLEFMEIDHQIAASVVAGGARRSARMSLKHWRDADILDFVHCKATGGHWSTNISVEIDDDFTTALDRGDMHAETVLRAICEGMARNAEPGWMNSSEHSRHEPGAIRNVNPCVTGDAWVQTTDGLRQVKDLVGLGKVELLVDGEVWSTGDEGFFATGHRDVLSLDVDGTVLKLTPEHLVSTPDGWRPAGELVAGDAVHVNESARPTESFVGVTRSPQTVSFDAHVALSAQPGTLVLDRPGHSKVSGVGTVRSVTPAGTEDVFDAQVPGRNAFVANGIVVHNCGEASLTTRNDADGSANGESCNLGSVNLEMFGRDIEGAVRAYELLARFLYRATLNPYPDDLANEIEADNRRIGAGFMGLQGWCLAHGVKLSDLPDNSYLLDALSTFRTATRFSADAFADSLGLPRPVKVTAIAPTGSISQMFGTQAGGHPVNATYYIRNVRYSTADAKVDELRAQGFKVEKAKVERNTVVVSFPTEDVVLSHGYDEALVESASDISLDRFAAVTLAIQESFCAGADGQAVSATGQLAPGQTPEEVAEQIRDYLNLKGFTAFPVGSYIQPPIEAVDKETYLALAVNVASMAEAYGDSNDGDCATGACPIK